LLWNSLQGGWEGIRGRMSSAPSLERHVRAALTHADACINRKQSLRYAATSRSYLLKKKPKLLVERKQRSAEENASRKERVF